MMNKGNCLFFSMSGSMACRFLTMQFAIAFTCQVFLAQAIYAQSLDDGLIAHYEFDGNANDSSGNGLHGVAYNNYEYLPGVHSAAIRLVGSGHTGLGGGHVLLPSLPFDTMPEFTISIWVNYEGNASFHSESFISFGRSASGNTIVKMNYTRNRQIDFSVGEWPVSGLVRVPFPMNFENSWNHLVLRADHGVLTGFINGQSVGSNSYVLNPGMMEDVAGIGVHWFNSGGTESNRYIGSVDDVRIYNRALSDGDIEDLYLSAFNQPPVADVGPDVVAECEGDLTLVALDGSMSSDPDGDELTYGWSVSAGSDAVIDSPGTVAPFGLFPVGSTLVTLTVSDGKGGTDSTDVLVTIEDTTPPVLICFTDKTKLWPPNHRMEEVWICVAASDACSQSENLQLACVVSSNEPDDSRGDGKTTGDVDGLDGFVSPVSIEMVYDELDDCFYGVVSLRAERDGSGSGRMYSIACEITDEHGNTATDICTVLVPHNKRKK